jgi:hypothetical protein
MTPKRSYHALQSYCGHVGRVKMSINEPNGAKHFFTPTDAHGFVMNRIFCYSNVDLLNKRRAERQRASNDYDS